MRYMPSCCSENGIEFAWVVVRTPEVYLDANDPETQDLTRVCRPVTRGLDIIRKLRIITR
jgi:hypothetical protein